MYVTKCVTEITGRFLSCLKKMLIYACRFRAAHSLMGSERQWLTEYPNYSSKLGANVVLLWVAEVRLTSLNWNTISSHILLDQYTRPWAPKCKQIMQWAYMLGWLWHSLMGALCEGFHQCLAYRWVRKYLNTTCISKYMSGYPSEHLHIRIQVLTIKHNHYFSALIPMTINSSLTSIMVRLEILSV